MDQGRTIGIIPANSPRSARAMIAGKWKIKKSAAVDILEKWTANGIIEHTDRDKKNHVSGYRKLIDL